MTNAAGNGPSDPDAPKTTMATQGAATQADDLGPDSSVLPGVLGWLDIGVARIEAVMLAAGVLLMAANTVANVIMRYVFGRSIQFTEELNSILIILITFAGISYAARHGRHIRMTAFFDMMSPRMRKVLMIVIALSTAVIMFGLAWYAWGYMLTQYGRGRVLPSLQIPVWSTLVWVPVGLFMTGLQYLLTAIKNMIDKDVWLSTNVLEGYADESDQEV